MGWCAWVVKIGDSWEFVDDLDDYTLQSEDEIALCIYLVADEKYVFDNTISGTLNGTETVTVEKDTYSFGWGASDKLTSAGYKTGLALDINIFKDITTSAGVKTTTQLIELPSVIDVTVDIPATLQGKAEYSVYRNHEGSVDILTTTKNADGEYIEVSKDGKKLTLHIKKFSEYVLGYKEATASSAVAPKTGDDTPIAVYILLSLIGCGFILTAKRRLKRA